MKKVTAGAALPIHQVALPLEVMFSLPVKIDVQTCKGHSCALTTGPTKLSFERQALSHKQALELVAISRFHFPAVGSYEP